MLNLHSILQNKEQVMISIMNKVLAWGMVAMAAITAWAVLTPNHLYIG